MASNFAFVVTFGWLLAAAHGQQITTCSAVPPNAVGSNGVFDCTQYSDTNTQYNTQPNTANTMVLVTRVVTTQTINGIGYGFIASSSTFITNEAPVIYIAILASNNRYYPITDQCHLITPTGTTNVAGDNVYTCTNVRLFTLTPGTYYIFCWQLSTAGRIITDPSGTLPTSLILPNDDSPTTDSNDPALYQSTSAVPMFIIPEPTHTATATLTSTTTSTDTATGTASNTNTQTQTTMPTHTPSSTTTLSSTQSTTPSGTSTATGTVTITSTSSETHSPTNTDLQTATTFLTRTSSPSPSPTPPTTLSATPVPRPVPRPQIPVGTTSVAQPQLSSQPLQPPALEQPQPAGGSSTGAIIGGVVGGVAGIVLVAAIAFTAYYCWNAGSRTSVAEEYAATFYTYAETVPTYPVAYGGTPYHVPPTTPVVFA